MRLLITGGAGFIGSNFVNYLDELDNSPIKVIVLDNLTYAGDFRNLSSVSNLDLTLVKGDICDKDLVFDIVSDIDYILHFAAESHVDNSIINPGKFLKSNLIGTQYLLDASVYYKIKKFVYISTDEIYGSISQGTFFETDNYNPSSPYSASKAAAELLVCSYSKTYGIEFNISRSSNNYGPLQNKEKLIPYFINSLINLKPVPIYGKGDNVRDWIYVKDNCEAIYKILCEGKKNEIYNISSGVELSNIDLARKLINLFDLNDKFIKFVEDRPGHDFRYSISSKKIKSHLGFETSTDFDTGLHKTVEWYKNNIDIY